LVFQAVRLVDYDELEGDELHDGLEVGEEDFEAGDQDVEFVQVGGLQDAAFCGDVGVVPLVVADARAAGLAVVVVV
jgi:hypothetical protein